MNRPHGEWELRALNVVKWIAIAAGISACLLIAIVFGPKAYYHKPIRWEAVGAAATLATAAFALVAAIINAQQAAINAEQARLTLLGIRTNALMEMDRQFNGPDYRRMRSVACRWLRDDPESPDTDKALEDVFDFFETVGLMTRRGALDEEMVHSTFFYWLHGYWLSSKIESQRTRFPARYGDAAWLHNLLVTMETSRTGTPDRTEWDDFLEEEIAVRETSGTDG